jgi:hypothetical protein
MRSAVTWMVHCSAPVSQSPSVFSFELPSVAGTAASVFGQGATQRLGSYGSVGI